MAKRTGNPDKFLTAEEGATVRAAIAAAEQRTSAELKLVIVRHAWDDLRARAARLFKKMGLDRTRERNAVMVLLVLANREYLIYGDRGIHEKVGARFWQDVRDLMGRAFRDDRFGEGLRAGIERIGAQLANHFPARENDVNEIPDEVAYHD